MKRRRQRSAVAFGAAVAVPMLAACGAFGGATTSASGTPEPMTVATAEMMPSPSGSSASASPETATSSGPAADATPPVATMTGGNGMGSKLILGPAAVPAGWQVSTPRETGGYRMTLCGVDLEPNAPIDGAQKRWQNSPTGPFLEQHVRVYADKTATAVVSGLAKAIPGCRGYTAADASGGSATYTVEQLKVAGAPAGFVTWRQRLTLPAPQPASSASPGSPAPRTAASPVLYQDVAVTRWGSSVVLLASYSVGQPPQPQILAGAVRALEAKR